jgi:tRNA (5-methylaminomethyl-2-thiouridylate)-methyltransferase
VVTFKPVHCRVVIGLSGGIDSTVVALLMIERGYHVSGVHLITLAPHFLDKDLPDVLSVAHWFQFSVSHINLSSLYQRRVLEGFIQSYLFGCTPNPDVLCNLFVKFGALLRYVLLFGYDFALTGHYSRSIKSNMKSILLKGLSFNKDQSYFLYLLVHKKLLPSFFPLGSIEKQTTRAITIKSRAVNAWRRDSTGVCLVTSERFTEFMSTLISTQPGPIKTMRNGILGEHHGINNYTDGSKRHIRSRQNKHRVINKTFTTKTLHLYTGVVTYEHFSLCTSTKTMINAPVNKELSQYGKHQSQSHSKSCLTYLSNLILPTTTLLNHKKDSVGYIVLRCLMMSPVVTSQHVVLYHGNQCIGGGVLQGDGNK